MAGEGTLLGIRKEIKADTGATADLSAYPILTEEIGYPPSPISRPPSGPQGPGGAGQGLGQTVARAVSDVLGWKANSADPKGFLGALSQAFSLTNVEGRVESTWNPRTYTVQTDLAGGITGAQASLYTRARDAQDQCLQLLDGLYPLDPDADPEYVKALREMAKSQIVEIVKQFAVVPPSILRVNTYFKILLGLREEQLTFTPSPTVEANPDNIAGTLGDLRDVYGIWFQKLPSQYGKLLRYEQTTALAPSTLNSNRFSNSVEDEQDITNFRVISDYMTSLLQSWLANGQYFQLSLGKAPAFLGTQLILISRQFNVIAETINEVRFTLDSVFIGPNERQQLLIPFKDGLHSMYLEDILREIEDFVSDEGPRLIRDGGRVAVGNNLLPVVGTMIGMIRDARHPHRPDLLPDGYRTTRVRNSLDDLRTQLEQLEILAGQVGMPVPPPSQIG
jgi:hypothetical protein